MTNKTNQVTADTITAQQIRALRDEATIAGDREMVEYCDEALPAFDLRRPVTEAVDHTAIAACVDAINAARAMEVAS